MVFPGGVPTAELTRLEKVVQVVHKKAPTGNANCSTLAHQSRQRAGAHANPNVVLKRSARVETLVTQLEFVCYLWAAEICIMTASFTNDMAISICILV